MMTDRMDEIEAAYAEKKLARRRVNLEFAANGVEFFDLDSAQIEEGVVIGAGTYVGPATIITGGTVIGKDCVIGQNCRIDGCRIGDGVTVEQSVMKDGEVGSGTTVGPFAYIRPGSVIGSGCRIGDFVEIKNSKIGDGTKVSHLTYVGDSDLGSDINLGCGVVFVNYDGRDKYRSVVGDGAFIGCNCNIISPVKIGAGAYLAAGGTVTRDVPPGALFIARDRGRSIEGWVAARGLLDKRLKKRSGKD